MIQPGMRSQGSFFVRLEDYSDSVRIVETNVPGGAKVARASRPRTTRKLCAAQCLIPSFSERTCAPGTVQHSMLK